jgi:hypothetical protein
MLLLPLPWFSQPSPLLRLEAQQQVPQPVVRLVPLLVVR